jgi:hypothetical protein
MVEACLLSVSGAWSLRSRQSDVTSHYTMSSFDNASVGEGLRDFTESDEGIVRRTRDILKVVNVANV